jgi:hypothetical protein
MLAVLITGGGSALDDALAPQWFLFHQKQKHTCEHQPDRSTQKNRGESRFSPRSKVA